MMLILGSVYKMICKFCNTEMMETKVNAGTKSEYSNYICPKCTAIYNGNYTLNINTERWIPGSLNSSIIMPQNKPVKTIIFRDISFGIPSIHDEVKIVLYSDGTYKEDRTGKVVTLKEDNNWYYEYNNQIVHKDRITFVKATETIGFIMHLCIPFLGYIIKSEPFKKIKERLFPVIDI